MDVKNLRKLVCSFLLSGLMLSCGGGGIEGQLSSVIVSASVVQSSVDADTAFWVDTDGDKVCDTYSIQPTTVDIVVSVEPLPNLPSSLTPSPVEIQRIDVVYSRADSISPSIPTEYRLVGMTLSPGSSATIPVEILSQSQKRNLINNYYLLRINPSLPIYRYYVNLRVRAREVYSGKTTTVERGFNMEVSDFVSENECP